MKKTIALFLTLCIGLMTTSSIHAEPPTVSDERVQELKDLRWGMFICWSFSTYSGIEWTPGIEEVTYFRSEEVDTDQWARTAKEAEMGYILFLSKHHDGFCLWDTETTDRKVTEAPLGRDVLAELRESCDKYGIKLALYFSESEWAWPDKPEGGRYQANGGFNPEMKKAQLEELLTQYGPIEYIWMDHAIGDGGMDHEETVAFCKALQPDCFIGFNHGPPAGDIRLGELGSPSALNDPSGAGFNHGHMQGYDGYRLAEFTYPILPPHKGGAMWFYSLPEHDELCHPPERLYSDYLGAVKYENIFSIDIGPNYNGRLRDIDVETLRKVGDMIRNPPPLPLSEGKPATASSVWSAAGYVPEKAFDGNDASRWGAEEESRSGWIEVDLEQEMEVARAVVSEIGYQRTQKFSIEYEVDGEWISIVSGTTIAGRQTYDFDPVVGRRFRLNILEANEVPSIEEFQLWAPESEEPSR
jgi:alpha-L-fucosidase